MKFKRKITLNIIMLISIIILTTFLTQPTIAMSEVIVDDSPENINEDNVVESIDEALDKVEDGGEIIIKESITDGYEGAYIGTNRDEWDDGKEITITGDGIIQVYAPSNQDAVFEIENNEHQNININNIIFQDSEYAIEAKSFTKVTIEDTVISSTISDEPFKLHNSVAGQSNTGAAIIDKGTYFSNQYSSNRNDVTTTIGGSINFESATEIGSDLIYDRQDEKLDVTPFAGKLSDVVQVGHSTMELTQDDDYNLDTPFYSIDKAIEYAEDNSIIEVYPRENNEIYEEINFNGLGLSVTDDITIHGQSVDGNLPIINDIEATYPGDYTIRNMQISGDVSAIQDSINIDVSENYWFSSDGPSVGDTNIPTGISSNIVEEPFCVDDSCVSSLEFRDLNKCINIESNRDEISYGCESSDESITIEFGEFEELQRLEKFNFDVEDYKQVDVDIEKENIDEDIDVEISILESDSRVDETFELNSDEQTKSTHIESQFSTILQQMELENIDVFPNAKVTINDKTSFTIELNDFTLNNPEFYNRTQVQSPPHLSVGNTQIISSDFTGVIKEEQTKVSRFNAGDDSQSVFRDTTIPPIQNGLGAVQGFEELRTSSERASIITPESDGLRMGLSMSGVSEANQHYLELTYALQGLDTDDNLNNVNVSIVDGNSNEIFNSRPTEDSQLNVTSTSEEPFSSVADTEGLETNRLQIPLHSQEIEYINNNRNAYIELENTEASDDIVLLLYDSKIISTDKFEVEDEEIEEGQPSIELPTERPGDFSVTFDVDEEFNTEFETYDIEPNNNLSATAILQNTGDTTIESSFRVKGNYTIPDGTYPEIGKDDSFGDATLENQKLEEYNVRIEPESTQQLPINLQFNESKFGTHEIEFVEVIEDENGNEMFRTPDDDIDNSFEVYVQQPTTLEVADINVPNEHFTHDNFEAQVTFENVGDLSGSQEYTAEFENWEVTEEVSVGSGDARNQESSSQTVVTFSRSDFESQINEEYEFSRREYTTVLDDVSEIHGLDSEDTFELSDVSFNYEDNDGNEEIYRPNSPFGVEEGTHDFTVNTHIDYTGEFIDEGASGNSIQKDLLKHETDSSIELNSIIIEDMRVNINPIESDSESVVYDRRPNEDEGTIYATPFPYVYPSMGSSDIGETYLNDPVENIGFGTVFDSIDLADEPRNRNALPLNHQDIPFLSSPDDKEYGIYHTHQNRICQNNEQYEGVRGSVFLPFSADSGDLNNICTDKNRFASIQQTLFERTTTNQNIINNVTDLQHPDNPTFEINGTNINNFEEISDENAIFYAYVTVTNPSTNQPGIARFQIESNRNVDALETSVGLGEPSGNDRIDIGDESFDDNVVGVGSVQLQPQQTRDVKVPIIIRNSEGNAGEHILSVHEYSEDDYTRRTSDYTPITDLGISEITNEYHSQFQVPINVNTYGDVIIEESEPAEIREPSGNDYDIAQEADLVVNNVCEGNEDEAISTRHNIIDDWSNDNTGTFSPDSREGLNPLSGNIDEEWGVQRTVAECNEDSPTDEMSAIIESTYTNYGGEPIEIKPNALSTIEVREEMMPHHIDNAHATGDRLFASYDDDIEIDMEPEIRVDGNPIDLGSSVEIQPQETVDIEFERQFQEPGLYTIRTSPCRAISEEGPQNYNLEGFTGIPDSPENYQTTITGLDRIGLGVGLNRLTTPEIENAPFHGSVGCKETETMVFVYDVTEPMPDFRIAESESKIQSNTDGSVGVELTDQTPDGAIEAEEPHDVGENFQVYEGGLLFFDGSTTDYCDDCYNQDTELGIPEHTGNADAFNPSNARENRISGEALKSHDMTESNTIISDIEWRINGNEPNYGDSNVCEEVDESDVDEHCYIESFTGDDRMEVITHRFAEPGDSIIELQAWDDYRFTENQEPNTATTEHTVEVIEAEEPTVNINYESFNDLNYANQGDIDYAEPIWHRNEEIIEYDELDNIEDEFENTYEGIRTCLDVEASDEQIGISQDAWYNLGDNTLVTDDGSYYDSDVHGVTDVGDVNVDETRDGDRRCVIFEEEDEQGNNERTQEFEYEAWNFGMNSDIDSINIDVESNMEEPDATLEHWTDSDSFQDGGDYVWAANDDTGYIGGDVTFDISGEDRGDDLIGLACLDLRVETNHGDLPIENCQSMDDGASVSEEIGPFTAEQLDYFSDNNDYSEPDGNIETELLKLTDWHSNTGEDTTDIEVAISNTNPDVSLTSDVNDYVWAASTETGYSGQSTTFDFAAEDETDGFSDTVGLYSYDMEMSGGPSNSDSTGLGRTKSDSYTANMDDLGYYAEDYSGGDHEITESAIATDLHDNTGSDSTSFDIAVDGTSPSVDCDDSDCSETDNQRDGEPSGTDEENYGDDFINTASAETCVTFERQGNHGGIALDGVEDSDGATITTNNNNEIEACVSASVTRSDLNADADAEADEPNPTCEEGDEETDYDTDYDRESDTSSATVEVIDRHGNTASETIRATARGDQFDTDRDERTKDAGEGLDCDDDDENGDDGGDDGRGDEDEFAD